jgi:YdjC-like protein
MGERIFSISEGTCTGVLIVNADDWGWDRERTDRIHACVSRGAVSSVSAMVFEKDSERAAVIARELKIDAGLHLNLTTPFSAVGTPTRLAEHHRRLSRYLRSYRFAQVVFHPGLVHSFDYVVKAQVEEFCRLYGAPPNRVDGHHHMHLCANVLWGGLMPAGASVRRNFSFQPGEKSLLNRSYRHLSDRLLARRHRITDFYFSLAPLDSPGHLRRIFQLARHYEVEVGTHPVNAEEFRFLAGGGIFAYTENLKISPCLPAPWPSIAT